MVSLSEKVVIVLLAVQAGAVKEGEVWRYGGLEACRHWGMEACSAGVAL